MSTFLLPCQILLFYPAFPSGFELFLRRMAHESKPLCFFHVFVLVQVFSNQIMVEVQVDVHFLLTVVQPNGFIIYISLFAVLDTVELLPKHFWIFLVVFPTKRFVRLLSDVAIGRRRRPFIVIDGSYCDLWTFQLILFLLPQVFLKIYRQPIFLFLHLFKLINCLFGVNIIYVGDHISLLFPKTNISH